MLNILMSLLFIIKGEKKVCAPVFGLLFFTFLLSGSESSLMKSGYWGEVDYISWWMIGLVLWLSGLCFLLGKSSISSGSFGSMLVLLAFFVGLSFYVRDLFNFYVVFEASLIPIIMMIGGWGNQSEKVEASYYMFMYTMFGSLPFLGYILYLSASAGSLMMGVCFMENSIFWVSMVAVFLIKFPVYGLHLWLLKAHLEAPTEGSMILAGVLLKLGGYGLVRVLSSNLEVLGAGLNFLVIFSLMGSLFMAISCLLETNVKLLVAKSSVVHMGPCVAGVLSMSESSLIGLVGLMVGHGLCSSGLFYLSGKMYEMSGSRSLMVNKSGVNYNPLFSFLLFMLLVVNSSAPPSLNLLSEISLFIGLGNMSFFNVLLLGFISFFSLGYNVYLFSVSQQGGDSLVLQSLKKSDVNMILIGCLHWLPVNLLILMLFSMK